MTVNGCNSHRLCKFQKINTLTGNFDHKQFWVTFLAAQQDLSIPQGIKLRNCANMGNEGSESLGDPCCPVNMDFNTVLVWEGKRKYPGPRFSAATVPLHLGWSSIPPIVKENLEENTGLVKGCSDTPKESMSNAHKSTWSLPLLGVG